MSDSDSTQHKPEIEHLLDCPKCGDSNPPELRYCESCGASLAGVEQRPKAQEAEAKKGGLLARIFGRRGGQEDRNVPDF